MKLSSADNPFKQFGPRSGSTFHPDLIGSKLFDTLEAWQVEVEAMYFNFALNLYKTLSSADNPFKQIGPRSGLTVCPDLKGVQTVWHYKGYDKLKLTRCIFTFVLNLYMTLSSADNPFKQFGPRSGSTFDTIKVMTSWSWTDVF